MRRFVEQCGNRPRDYHNSLALAVPDRRIAEMAKNAVSSLITLEKLQARSYAIELTPNQLAERKSSVEKEMKSAFLLLYQHVYVPITSNRSDTIFTFDDVAIMNYSQAP